MNWVSCQSDIVLKWLVSVFNDRTHWNDYFILKYLISFAKLVIALLFYA
jgi:hypothetical protein